MSDGNPELKTGIVKRFVQVLLTVVFQATVLFLSAGRITLWEAKMSKKAIVVLAVLALLLAGCGRSEGETPTPEVEAEYTPVVSVTGEVVPAVWATVSTQTGGFVEEVLVEPGDEVEKGEILIRLDSTDAQLAVQQAEAALAAAQAQLDDLKAGARPEEIEAAKAEVALAQAALQSLLNPDPAQVAAAQAELAQAEAALRIAQAAYDRIKWDPGAGARPEALQLEQATGAYNVAKARLDALLNPPAADVAAARARLQQAQARLALLEAGARLETIAAAEAEVARAEAALEQARVALARCEIRAPFAGTVGLVHVRTGEWTAPGQPLVTLGDLTTLRVETTDLDEVDVARVAVGQQAVITFDALPERTFTGRVTRISPMAEPGTAGVHYTVVIELDELHPAIRWGMTAFVDIEVGE